MKRPPGLLARTMTVTFATVAVVLAIVFVVLIVDTRERVRTAETERLQIGEGLFTALEARRQRDERAMVAALAEAPTLKAALDTYVTESQFSTLDGNHEAELRRTVAREVQNVAASTAADVLAVLDADGRVFASAGPERHRWPHGGQVDLDAGGDATFQGVAMVPSGAFHISGAPLRVGDHDLGAFVLGTSLDARYARELSTLSHAQIVITVNDAVVGNTASDAVARDLLAAAVETTRDTLRLDGDEYAMRVLLATGPVRIYMLSSIDAAARSATRAALAALGTLAAGSLLLAGVASLWLARMLAGPIGRVAHAIAGATTGQAGRPHLELTGTSRELDALTAAFNELMTGLTSAEAETRAAYLGAIKGLAAALDARDPYTAGHSERVSAIAVLIAGRMQLEARDIEVIRLGALLHDIGKIGVRDDILRKPGRLTPEEFEHIKRHPGLGARILRQVPFLAPYLPVVELHHEQPDGRGYPFGLCGDDIPVPARIVHVADTFDAMTSARAYRPALPRPAAFAELRRFSGTQFDAAAVEALIAALVPAAETAPPHEPSLTAVAASQHGQLLSAQAAMTPEHGPQLLRRGHEMRILTALALCCGVATPCLAQQARVAALAVDSTVSFDEAVDQDGQVVPGLVVDSVVSAGLGGGVEAIVRPWAQRSGQTGEWNRQVWLATLRYERGGRVGVRVDGGLITSPVGYGNMMLRAPMNPTIALPSSLFQPLPAAAPGLPRATLLGVMYPYGISGTASTTRWDMRAALVDTSPMRMRRVFARNKPPRFATVVLGGGITPAAGFRAGASITRGGWQSAPEIAARIGAASASRSAMATIVAVETEYAVRHTKVAGEWVRNAFETQPGTTVVASGWFVQGQHTLAPRWFAAGRVERMSAPVQLPADASRQVFAGVESTLGYRLTPEITIRGGHRARRFFTRTDVDHAATMSIVWWQRWK